MVINRESSEWSVEVDFYLVDRVHVLATLQVLVAAQKQTDHAEYTKI